MFENNKAFAMFQVFEVNRPADESRLFLFAPFVINAGRKRTLTVFNNGLALEIFSDQMHLKKFTAGGNVMPSTDPVLPRLSSALGGEVSSIGDLSGHKCVMSFSRNSDGQFEIYFNSILVYSHTDTGPFQRLNGVEEAAFMVGGQSFSNGTTSKFY